MGLTTRLGQQLQDCRTHMREVITQCLTETQKLHVGAAVEDAVGLASDLLAGAREESAATHGYSGAGGGGGGAGGGAGSSVVVLKE